MPPPRLFWRPQGTTDGPLPEPGAVLALPSDLVRHVQVLRLQPGDAVVLFGDLSSEELARQGDAGPAPATTGREWLGVLQTMGRNEATVRIDSVSPVSRELPIPVRLAVGMPANDRMDGIVEKATELGARHIQPLVCRRSVLRLEGSRADKRVAHWGGVAVAAAEQCGRTTPTAVGPVLGLAPWLDSLPRQDDVGAWRWLLSTQDAPSLLQAWQTRGPAATNAQPWAAGIQQASQAPRSPRSIWLLSGPEGGLTAEEEAAACAAGFRPVSLGPRILRADTAPLAALAVLAALMAG